MAHYLVTGGAGFIGSHIVEALLRMGHAVRVLDNFSSGKYANLIPFLSRIELIEGDIRDADLCRKVMAGMDYVSHQAAIGSVPASIDDPRTTHEVNETGTLNLLLAARRVGVRGFVFASSSAIYGDSPELPKREDFKPLPKSPYALSKYAAETYCRLFTELYGLPTVSLRYFNVFGPRQDETGQYAAVIPKFCLALTRETAPLIYGDGEQTRDFCFIENVVDANLKAFQSQRDAWGKTFNIACNRLMSLNGLLAVLQRAVKLLHPELTIKPARYELVREGDVMASQADYGLAAQYLDYEPLVDVEEGLARTQAWYLQQEKRARRLGLQARSTLPALV